MQKTIDHAGTSSTKYKIHIMVSSLTYSKRENCMPNTTTGKKKTTTKLMPINVTSRFTGSTTQHQPVELRTRRSRLSVVGRTFELIKTLTVVD